MAYQTGLSNVRSKALWLAQLGLLAVLLPFAPLANAVQVTVVSPKPNGTPISVGYRWILEEDRTYEAKPGTPLSDTQATNLYRSNMPVAATGRAASGAETTINVPDPLKRYLLSVLPDQGGGLDCQKSGCYTMSGKQILPGQLAVQVVVTPQPVPTAQIFIRAYEDTSPINNVWDNTETALGGFTVFIYDMAGQMNTDTFGNPLGTVYVGQNADGTPRVARLGDGTIHTMTAAEQGDPAKNPYGLEVGEALVKGLAPGKYGVRVIPPYGQGWQQTSTIEGTPGQDTWVKANEPRYFAEFGPAGHHAEYGFVKNAELPSAAGHYPARNGAGSISGTIVNQRMSRPSDAPGASWAFSGGHKLPGCWVGLNNSAGVGVYAGPCDADSNFSITGLAPGTYQLVVFDQYLDLIVNMVSVDVGVNTQPLVRTGLTVPTFRWFQTHEHWVFNDLNENGIRDLGEAGIPDQAINLRYRDGSIYSSSTTDTTGYLPFDEVFPFFSWLIAEVDFARFKATGATIGVDAGGAVTGAEVGGEVATTVRPGNVGHGHLNPQLQNPTECTNGVNGCQTRTELSNPVPVLLEGYNAFLGTTNVFEWGKKAYDTVSEATAGENRAPLDLNKDGDTLDVFQENGGITGVVYYQTTRAENDARFAAPETWEPGIPRVQVNLYRSDTRGAILDGGNGLQLADIDNYPFCWSDAAGHPDECASGTARGLEDVNRTGSDVIFDLGDALEITHTDSSDDSPPTNCPGNPLDTFHMPPAGEAATPYNGRCYDGLRNFNQVRPAVFDGGYAFGYPFSEQYLAAGNYVVESNPPLGYQIQKEEDKNVDFGDAMTVSKQALPPLCVGDAHTVPAELTLFPGVAAEYAGQSRPLCDRKVVFLTDGKNAASDFFMFTEVPITGHIQGFVLNDLANEFDPRSPNFGEKFAPSFIPVSVRDYAGNEVYHTTTDAWGTYNAIVPSAYRINTPMPSGVSPNMLQVCLNSPMKEDPANPGKYIADPNFNKQYTQFCYTLNFQPGQTTFLDTPVLPIAAYAGPGSAQLDCEYPTGTPIIHSVVSNQYSGPVVGAPVVGASGIRTLTITSVGTVQVPDPLTPPLDGNNANLVARDFGFGASQGTGSVTLNGLALTVTSWNAGSIMVTVPPAARTGELVITRSNGLKTVHAVTVIVGADPLKVHQVTPGSKIQDVIDAPTTRAGDIVLVPTGNYQEMLVMTKPIQLQGAGAPSTIINPVQSPTEKIDAWRAKVNYLANCSHQLGLLTGQGNNVANVTSQCGFTAGTGLFAGDEGPGVLVAPVAGAFNGTPARIDGFTITGADQSAGILVNGNANFLEISNNDIANNQGGSAAGIRIGHPTLLDANNDLVDANNDNINIHHNRVRQNGGLFEPGAGVGLYTGSDKYRVTNNNICGNFAQNDGGGIAHYGRSPGGMIADNKILFNQTFDQTAGAGGSGGGILIAGHEPQVGAAIPLSPGSGSVQVLRNLIQGNNAGSGDGGGIALRFINGQDVLTVSDLGTANIIRNRLDSVQILNNSIVNNVTGLAGGGVSMLDALNAHLVNNTIANNDSTATAAAALNPLTNDSAGPQPAGIVSRANSPALLTAAATRIAAVRIAVGTFSNPTLINDIILGNRSMVWSVTGSFPSTGQLYGSLADASPLRFWDLAVLGTPGNLSPVSSLLTLAAESIGGQPACLVVGNLCRSGELPAESAILVAPYRHGTVSGTGVPGGEFPILAAAALDEGGNFIDVHFGPLTTIGSDYHLAGAASPAVDVGATPGAIAYPQRSPDIDGQARPRCITAVGQPCAFDIGADELLRAGDRAGAGGNQAPQIVSTLPNSILLPIFGTVAATYAGSPFVYQVVAVDPNGDAITYSLQGRDNCTVVSLPAALPAGIQIDVNSGAITWTPTVGQISPVNPRCFRVIATDTGGASSFQAFGLTTLAAGAPTANPDTIAVTNSGTFVRAAPGVLGNDSNPGALLYGPMTAQLLGNLNVGGTVGLEASGALTYTPEPDFVGAAQFTYVARNRSGSSAPATVTLVRELAAQDAQFVGGNWNLNGLGSLPDRTLTFVLVRTGYPLGTTVVAADGSWSLSAPGPAWQAGDTVAITASGGTPPPPLPPPFTLTVAVSSLSADTAPQSTAYVQCPGDTNGNALQDNGEVWPAKQVCRHLGAGDGFAVMGDGKEIYTFGFNDLTGVDPNLAIDQGILNAHFPAPTLSFKEGDQAYITLTNVGMLKRPDLFDPHSVHFHGFPNAGTVFDGVPESSISINMGFSLTYYYKIQEPGTFMYHCHVEASEHMQMGMLGNLFVDPAQNGTVIGGRDKFVYNDVDGSTGYDVFKAIQIGSFDGNFHDLHIGVQPLPFAEMRDDYPMLNGRGYPDTIGGDVPAGGEKSDSGVTSAGESSQTLDTVVTATAGQKILLRISNLNVTQFNTLATTGGLQMQVVGIGAHVLRGPGATNGTGADLYYKTRSVTLGGGEAADVLIDTTGVAPGKYLLYTTNLNNLSNGPQDFGGMMTEIVITAP